MAQRVARAVGAGRTRPADLGGRGGVRRGVEEKIFAGGETRRGGRAARRGTGAGAVRLLCGFRARARFTRSIRARPAPDGRRRSRAVTLVSEGGGSLRRARP